MRWKVVGTTVSAANIVLMFSNLVLLSLFIHGRHQFDQERSLQMAQDSQAGKGCQPADKLQQERMGTIDSDWAWNSDWDGQESSVVGKPGLSWITRRLFLVRHGAYDKSGPKQGHLNKVGIRQMENTGERLKRMNISFSKIIVSTSTRADESADILFNYISTVNSKVTKTATLREGRPTFPNPGIDTWDPNDKSFRDDGTRIEEAFRTCFYRPPVDEKKTYNDLIVAHGNVISYFTLRALQLPPERWGKISIYQGSITLFEISTNGELSVKFLGDVGHISPRDWTGA